MESKSPLVLEGSNGEGAGLKSVWGNGLGFKGLNPNSALGRSESRPSLLDSALKGNSDADSEVAATTATTVAGALHNSNLLVDVNASEIHPPLHNFIPPCGAPSHSQNFTPFYNQAVPGPNPPIPDYRYSPYPPPYFGARSQITNPSRENTFQNPDPWGHQFNRGWYPQSGRQDMVHKGVGMLVQPYFGPAPGYMSWPVFQGTASTSHGPVYSKSYEAPYNYMATNPSQPSPHPVPQSYTLALRDRIVVQIEYYFCKENLVKDLYLRKLFDEEGWVPISKIANFNRVRSMKVSNGFILDALQSSPHIEVQGDKIRKRTGWSDWVLSLDKGQEKRSLNSLEQGEKNLRALDEDNTRGLKIKK